MAQGWEPVQTRESFELDTLPPPSRRRQRPLPRKRFMITGGVLLLLIVLYFASSNIRGKDDLSQDQTTFEDPTVIDIPLIPKPDAPPFPTADVDNSVPPSPTDNIPAEPSSDTPPPIPSNDVVELEPVKPASPPVSIYTAPPPEPTNPLSTIKAAVIIESRLLSNLVPIILHFSSILGSDWPIHIFTDGSNSRLFSASPAFQRGIRDGRLRVRSLPSGVNLTTQAALSGFFTKPWLWENMAPAEHVLIFQTDSMLCANSPQKVEFFFEYDFVGAPINSERKLGMGYNGGLSLRNRTLSLEITKEFDWQTERNGDHSEGDPDYEDQWFSQKMSKMGANLPTTEVAMEFSVETMWYDKPLGYHRPFVWQQTRMKEIEKWCPEIKMCTIETFTQR